VPRRSGRWGRCRGGRAAGVGAAEVGAAEVGPLGCSEFPTRRLVYSGITDEMINYTVSSVREFVADRRSARRRNSRHHRGHMTNVIAMCGRHSLLRAQLPDYRR
jgi:hypothetical protein